MNEHTMTAPRTFDLPAFRQMLGFLSDCGARVEGAVDCGFHDWPAMWAVLEACRVGNQEAAFTALLDEERRQIKIDDLERDTRLQLLAQAQKVFAGPRLLANSPATYVLRGMVACHDDSDDDMNCGAAPTLLHAALVRAMGHSVSTLLAKAARCLVLRPHSIAAGEVAGTMREKALAGQAAARAASDRIVTALRPAELKSAASWPAPLNPR